MAGLFIAILAALLLRDLVRWALPIIPVAWRYRCYSNAVSTTPAFPIRFVRMAARKAWR
jgi:hypothetical protein